MPERVRSLPSIVEDGDLQQLHWDGSKVRWTISSCKEAKDERSVNEVEREYAFRVTRHKSGG